MFLVVKIASSFWYVIENVLEEIQSLVANDQWYNLYWHPPPHIPKDGRWLIKIVKLNLGLEAIGILGAIVGIMSGSILLNL